MTDVSLLLVVVGKENPKSCDFIAKVEKLCEKSDVNITVLDLIENPHIADTLKIIATPILIKTLPKPVRKFIGDLSNINVDQICDIEKDLQF